MADRSTGANSRSALAMWMTIAAWLLAGALTLLLALLVRALVRDFWVIVIAWSQP